MTRVHFIDVGQGNMVLVVCETGTTILYDCNITDENRSRVLTYLKKIMPKNSIDVFVNSHRDCDHMRNVSDVHRLFPIKQVWDSGETGTSPQDSIYQGYMNLKRNVGSYIPKVGEQWEVGSAKITCLNSCHNDMCDPNAQSIVLKIEYQGSSVLLTGDADASTWRKKIVPRFSNMLKSNILLGGHHGSDSFFDDPADERNYYVEHMKLIRPEVTIISVGDNVHGHPHDKALKMYENHTSGSDNGVKVVRTDHKGNILLELMGQGYCSLHYYQS